MKLVSLEQARAHLRIDTDDDDLDLDLKVQAASGAVFAHLKDFVDTFTDSAGDVIEGAVPPLVQAATLMMVGYFYREREGSSEFSVASQWGFGYLPAGVEAILYPLRRPTVV